MTHVLIAVDADEERAKAQADAIDDLGHPDEVSVTVLHVFTENPEGASVTQVSSARHIAEQLEESGFEVDMAESSSDDPAESIIEHAADLDVDFICVSGRQRSPTGKALFGSTSQQVLLESDVPVLFCSS